MPIVFLSLSSAKSVPSLGNFLTTSDVHIPLC